MKKNSSLSHWLAAALLVLSFGLGAWTVWPLPRGEQSTPLDPFEGQAVSGESMTEQRVARISWPRKVRRGEETEIRLTLEVEEPLTTDGSTSAEPGRGPGLYADYNLIAEARLEMAGLEYGPQGAVLEPLRPGQAAHFYWSLQSQAEGAARGTLWLFLVLIPEAGGETQRAAMLALPLEVEVVSLWGLSVGAARWGAGLCGALGLLLGVPGVGKRLRPREGGGYSTNSQKRESF